MESLDRWFAPILAVLLLATSISARASEEELPGSECSGTCATYNGAEAEDSVVAAYCGGLGYTSGTQEYSDCESGYRATFDDNSAKCEVIALAQKAYQHDQTTMWTYLGATAVCAAACACQMGVQAVFCGGALIAACTIGGLGATAADFIGTGDLSAAGSEWEDRWVQSALNWGGAGGSLAAGALGVMAVAGASKEVVSSAGKAASEGGKATGGSTASKIASCAAAGLYGVTAALKGTTGVDNAKNAAESACSSILSLSSASGGYAEVPTSGSIPTGGSAGDSGTSDTSTTGGTGTTDTASAAESVYSAPTTSEATAGPLSKLLNKMPNKAQIPEALKSLGTDLKSLGKAAEKSSVGAALAGIPALAGMGEAMKDFDRLAKNIKSDVDGTLYSGGGKGSGGGKSAQQNPFGLFGAGSAPKSADPKELKFGEQRKPAGTGTDIWHAGYGGTIFDIVTFRIGASRERVASLPWATPMNRMLSGAPAKGP